MLVETSKAIGEMSKHAQHHKPAQSQEPPGYTEPMRPPPQDAMEGYEGRDRRFAGIAVEDIGRTAYGILKRGEPLVDKTVST